MTYKQPDGLDPRRYKNRISAPVSRALVKRSETRPLANRERRASLVHVRAARAATGGQAFATSRRIVTTPHEAVQPLTWAERHARYRARPTKPQHGQERLVPRTLAQTGRPAPIGQQMRARKSLPPQRVISRPLSRVPVRSGKLRRSGSFWRRLLGIIFVLAVVVGGLGFALFSPTFQVQEVDIKGTQNQQLLASIRHLGMQGQDIFQLNQAALLARVESQPTVASASVSVQLPHTVTVAVQERVPILLWQAGHLVFGLAQDGVVIAPQSELSGTENLAVVVDARKSANQVHPGTRFNAVDIVFVEQVFEQVSGMKGVAPFSLQYVDTINVDGRVVPANQAGSGSYVIVSDNGWRAYLGDAQNSTSLADRLLELQQIVSMAHQQNVRLATIDVRFGLRPTYTLKA